MCLTPSHREVPRATPAVGPTRARRVVACASVAAVCAAALGCRESTAATPVRDDAAPPQTQSAEAPPPSESAAPAPSASTAAAEDATLRLASGEPAAAATRVLHVGDSMVPLVGNYLRPIFQSSGRKYFIDSVTSASTLDFGEKGLLQQAMYRYDPDLVLISLGSNELFDPKPERRAPAIRQIVAHTRGRPCLWIGPPAWKRDLGFIQVLRNNLGHCRYFDSARLDLPRMADGRHPDWTGGYRWASAVWTLLGGTEPVPTGNRRPD
ncbi:MAG: hypothetical protein KF718_13790 [Polyangiaceae bacterium]|nr:hypothetical protein [Polyangiaceae bacterium]